jgi:hypothetical protein
LRVFGLLSAVAPDLEQLEHAERRFQILVAEKHIDPIAPADLAHEVGNAVAVAQSGLVADDGFAARERCVAEPIDLPLAVRIALVGPGVGDIAAWSFRGVAAVDEDQRLLFARRDGRRRGFDLPFETKPPLRLFDELAKPREQGLGLPAAGLDDDLAAPTLGDFLFDQGAGAGRLLERGDPVAPIDASAAGDVADARYQRPDQPVMQERIAVTPFMDRLRGLPREPDRIGDFGARRRQFRREIFGNVVVTPVELETDAASAHHIEKQRALGRGFDPATP